MPKSCNSISRRSHGRGWLTVSSIAWKCLFLIGIVFLWSQEVNEMVREPCNRLELWNQLSTFLWFFQVFFVFLRLKNLLIFVCKCSLYTEEWIRFTKVHSIFVNYWFWSWFDSLEDLSKIRSKPIFSCTKRPCTNSIFC